MGRFLPIVVASLVVLGVCWLFLPGLLSSDSQTILEEAKNWSFTSGHPPIMGMIWGALYRIRPGSHLMLVAKLPYSALASGY